MGFLQQDTNNIILDAVLTKEGRRRLASNDGSFRITHFSLGDDEVDYSIINKYGRAVGREKIEKNTPVFEALTDGNLESYSRLVTVSDDSISAMSLYTVTLPSGAASLTFDNVIGSNPENEITVKQTGASNSSIPPEIQDSVIVVSMDRRFLQIKSKSPFQSVGNVDYYNVVSSGGNNANQSVFNLSVLSKSLTDDNFVVFGNSSSSTQISTTIRVQGRQSGMTRNISAVLNKN